MILAELIKKGSLTQDESTEEGPNCSNCSQSSRSRFITTQKRIGHNTNNINELNVLRSKQNNKGQEPVSCLSIEIKKSNMHHATATIATPATLQWCLNHPCEHSSRRFVDDNVVAWPWCQHQNKAVIDMPKCPLHLWEKDSNGFPKR